MKTITIDFPGLSLNDVRKQNKKLFWKSQTWYADEAFANEVIPAGKWEVRLEPCTDSLNKTWEEQQATLPDLVYEVPPAAVLAYAVVEYFKKTDGRAFERVWVRTSSCDSDGDHVFVGRFDAEGLSVVYSWDVYRYSNVGLAAARKLSVETRELEPVESSDLETRLARVEEILKHHRLGV